jgi:hypothetical protein
VTTRKARFARAVQTNIKRYGWLGGPVGLVGLGLIALVNEISPSHTIKVTPTALSPTTSVSINDLGTRGTFGLWVGVSLAAIGFIVFALWLSQRQYDASNRQSQIAALTNSLHNAMGIIASINAEVEEGERVLIELQSRTADQKELAKLTKEEAEAVRNLVGTEIRGERRFALTAQVIVGIVAGIIAGFLLAHL